MAVLPGRLAKTLPNVQLQIPPIEVEGFTILMSWHERTHHDIAHAWIRELVVALMLIQSISTCKIPAMHSRIAVLCGASLGDSQITVCKGVNIKTLTDF